jgi:alkylated DNA repair dioxygenase AlkB
MVQLDFFDGAKRPRKPEPKRPEGLRYQAALISTNDEAALIERVRTLPFREFDFHGFLGKRRVVSFGWKYDYSSQRIQKAEDIPDYLLSLRALAALFANLQPEALPQALVTEYAEGAGIGWHRDKAVFGQVVGISLLSPFTLRFRKLGTFKPPRRTTFRLSPERSCTIGVGTQHLPRRRTALLNHVPQHG